MPLCCLQTYSIRSAVTVYDDRQTFAEAAGSLMTINFESFDTGPLCLPTQPYVPVPCTLLEKGVTFAAIVGFPDSERPLLTIDVSA